MATAWIESDPPTPQRVVLGWVTSVGTVAGLVLLAWMVADAWRDSLPDPIAIHWGVGGAADGTATLDGTIRVTTALGLAGVATMVVLGAALLSRPRLLRGWMTGLAATAALAPASLLLSLVPNRGVPSWQEARLSGWALALVVVLPAVTAAVAWVVAARPARLLAVGPRIPRDAPIAVSHDPYVERQVMRAGLWVAAAMLLAMAPAALVAGGALLGLLALIAAALAWLSLYRYRVDDEGITLTLGPVGPLRRRVPVTELEGAQASSLRAGDWGGWGYRTNGRDWAVVVRSGPATRVDLAGRRTLSLTSGTPDRLAARVNAAVQRHWAG